MWGRMWVRRDRGKGRCETNRSRYHGRTNGGQCSRVKPESSSIIGSSSESAAKMPMTRKALTAAKAMTICKAGVPSGACEFFLSTIDL